MGPFVDVGIKIVLRLEGEIAFRVSMSLMEVVDRTVNGLGILGDIRNFISTCGQTRQRSQVKLSLHSGELRNRCRSERSFCRGLAAHAKGVRVHVGVIFYVEGH